MSNNIYDTATMLSYAGINYVHYVRKEIINNKEHVVMIDSFGNEKTVYIELYEKHVKIMSDKYK